MAFVLFAQVLFPFTADAQNQYLQDWTFHTDSVEEDIHRYEMHINELAEVFIAGANYNDDSLLVYKIDSTGNLIWHYKYLIASGNNGYFNSKKIGVDSDYNYYLSTYGNRLIKLDSAGQVNQIYIDTLYSNIHPPPLYNSYSGIIGCTNDHIYVTKKFHIAVSVCCYPEISYLTKYDHQFNVIWSRKVSSSYLNDIKYFQTDDNDNVYICVDTMGLSALISFRSFQLAFDPNGDTLSYNSMETGNTGFLFFYTQPSNGSVVARQYHLPSPNIYSRSIALSAYDTSGAQLWTDTIHAGQFSNEEATAVYRDESENCYLLSWVSGYNLNSNFQGAIRLRKYDANGNLIRTQSWSGNDTLHGIYTGAQKLIIMPDHFFILGSISNTGTLADAIIIKSDTSGNTLWSAQYAVGDSLRDNFMRMETDACGNLYVTGRTDSINNTMNYVNLVRFITEIPCYVSDSEMPEKSSSTLIYPNPATSQIRIRRPEGTNREPIYLYDILGKNIMTIKSSITKQPSEEMLQDVSALPRGIYLATDNHGFFEKLILQ